MLDYFQKNQKKTNANQKKTNALHFEGLFKDDFGFLTKCLIYFLEKTRFRRTDAELIFIAI